MHLPLGYSIPSFPTRMFSPTIISPSLKTEVCIAGSETVIFRQATEEDLDSIVLMLSDDNLGTSRERYERPLPGSYVKAFRAIYADSNIDTFHLKQHVQIRPIGSRHNNSQ